MAVRPTERKQGNIAAVAASLLLTALVAAPTLASHDVVEPDSADKVDVLSADHLLKPRVEATVREVFADSDDEAEPAEAVQTEADEPVIMNTRVPGVSDDELARFKRQMYRKDI